MPVSAGIAGMIDHTMLRPDATAGEIRQLCREALDNRFAAVCVNPYYIPLVSALLAGSEVKGCAVIGFPLGACLPVDKAGEARSVLAAGAQEVDMVLNIGALKDGLDDLVRADIAGVAAVCHEGGAILKVILETVLLDQEQKERACRLCVEADADFVKTSTGFGGGGATVEDVRLMAAAVREAGLGVKASGGVRSYAVAQALIDAGATRIGTSSGLAIVRESRG